MKDNKTVRIKLPKAPIGEEESVFVGCNGVCYNILRGVEVEVPECVAAILLESERAEDNARDFLMQKAGK